MLFTWPEAWLRFEVVACAFDMVSRIWPAIFSSRRSIRRARGLFKTYEQVICVTHCAIDTVQCNIQFAPTCLSLRLRHS